MSAHPGQLPGELAERAGALAACMRKWTSPVGMDHRDCDHGKARSRLWDIPRLGTGWPIEQQNLGCPNLCDHV
jgi:hypothetical protein